MRKLWSNADYDQLAGLQHPRDGRATRSTSKHQVAPATVTSTSHWTPLHTSDPVTNNEMHLAVGSGAWWLVHAWPWLCEAVARRTAKILQAPGPIAGLAEKRLAEKSDAAHCEAAEHMEQEGRAVQRCERVSFGSPKHDDMRQITAPNSSNFSCRFRRRSVWNQECQIFQKQPRRGFAEIRQCLPHRSCDQ